MKKAALAVLLIAVIISSVFALSACDVSEGIIVDKYEGVSPIDLSRRYYVVVEGADGKRQRFVARSEEVFNAFEIGDDFSYNWLYWLLDGSSGGARNNTDSDTRSEG